MIPPTSRARKPVFRVSDQVRHKLVSSAREDCEGVLPVGSEKKNLCGGTGELRQCFELMQKSGFLMM